MISKLYFGKKNHGRNRNVPGEAMNASILKVHGSEVQEKNQPPHYVKQKQKHDKYESEQFLCYLLK